MANTGKESVVDALEEASKGISAETDKDGKAKEDWSVMNNEPLKKRGCVVKDKRNAQYQLQ
eukprot:12248316-Ditylum_brightwellii.AAC.1